MAVTLFTSLGNAQDNAVSVSPDAGGTGSATQGNVAMKKVLHEADLQRAASASREQKALKEAMTAYAQKPAPITTAEQFLAAHRPPAAPPREGNAALSRMKTSTEVPEFLPNPGPVRTSSSGAEARTIRAAAPPGSKPGWFDLFKSKKGSAAVTESSRNPDAREESAPPAADYPPPGGVPVEMTKPDAATATDQQVALAAAANSSNSPALKSDFFSRIFGKGKKAGATPFPAAGDEGTPSPVPMQTLIPSSGLPAGPLGEGTPVPTTAPEN